MLFQQVSTLQNLIKSSFISYLFLTVHFGFFSTFLVICISVLNVYNSSAITWYWLSAVCSFYLKTWLYCCRNLLFTKFLGYVMRKGIGKHHDDRKDQWQKKQMWISRNDDRWFKTMAWRNFINIINPEHRRPRSVKRHGFLIHLSGHMLKMRLILTNGCLSGLTSALAFILAC